MSEVLDSLKPLETVEEHPLLADDLDKDRWKYRLWKYENGWPMYYSFQGDGERKRVKNKISEINERLEKKLT